MSATTGTTVRYDLVVVAGGGGERLGGAVKADLVVGGQRLLERVLAATTEATARVVVGAGIEVPDGVLVTLEDPPSGGPAAGTAAGLEALADPAPWTLLLASDLADPAPGIATLLEAAAAADADGEDIDGVCLAGDAEHPQWLFGIHRTPALHAAVEALDSVRDRSMKALLSPLRLRTVAVAPDAVADIDTPDDLARWRERHVEAEASHRPPRIGTDHAQEERWRAWVELAAAAVGADPDDVDITLVHRLTKQIAHGYDRPLAPVGAYIVGLAVGAARARGEEVDATALGRAVAATIYDAPPVPEEER